MRWAWAVATLLPSLAWPRPPARGPVGAARRVMGGAAVLCALVALADLLGQAAAAPPAALVESAPRDGEVVAAPRALLLRFSGPVDHKACSVSLVTPEKRTILLLKVQPRTAPDTLAYDLPPLPPGAHQARWRLVIAGQSTEGTLSFTVKPATPGR
ncbi:MAG: copper resistance protein CopC [Candidatus Rokubacteria bacterium]|nr:copper resistance protein CopC [Candidatus Rokubacteria bacterium]